MTPDTLRAVGEALYGLRWQTPLAHDVGVNDRTMRRWLAGTNPMPERLQANLRAIVKNRIKALSHLMV